VHCSRIYEHLGKVYRPIKKKLFKTIGVEVYGWFVSFFYKFLAWKYIFDYKDLDQISKPLINISKRIWTFETPKGIHEGLTAVLVDYCNGDMKDFKDIYTYIQDNLTYLS